MRERTKRGILPLTTRTKYNQRLTSAFGKCEGRPFSVLGDLYEYEQVKKYVIQIEFLEREEAPRRSP
jgi:hypothetical protein